VFTLQVQLAPINVLVEMPMTRWLFGGLFPWTHRKCPCKMPEAHRESAVTVQVSAEMLMTGRLCWSVPYIVRVPLHLLERPVSGCRPSLLEPAILKFILTNQLIRWGVELTVDVAARHIICEDLTKLKNFNLLNFAWSAYAYLPTILSKPNKQCTLLV